MLNCQFAGIRWKIRSASPAHSAPALRRAVLHSDAGT
jgi:hypothetical protein